MFTLEECYEKGLLRKTQPSFQKALRSLDSARTWLEEGKVTLRAGAVRSAVVATYMAYFHAARSLLYRDGLREKSHRCILLYLEFYTANGKLETEFVETFERVMSLRHEDQYSLGAEPDPREIASILAYAPRFIQAMEDLAREG